LLGEPNDAFWLAQAHFLMGHYLRAEKILTGPLPPSRMPRLGSVVKGDEEVDEVEGRAGEEPGRGKRKDVGMRDFSMIAGPRNRLNEAQEDVEDDEVQHEDEDEEEGDQSWIGDLMKNTRGGLWGALNSVGDKGQARRTGFGVTSDRSGGEALTEWSMPCKYLAALCMVSEDKRGAGRPRRGRLRSRKKE
jgi:hypothetical protein